MGMSSIESKLFLVVHFVCWAGAIALTGYWIYEFKLNKDLCTVDYKKYYDGEKDVFPVLSICFRDPISMERLKRLSPGINQSLYIKFLSGKVFMPNISLIDYPKVILNLTDHIAEDFIRYRNGSYLSVHPEYLNDSNYGDNVSNNHGKREFSSNYGLFLGSTFYNCYDLSVPHDKDIHGYYYRMNNTIFPFGIRHQRDNFGAILHYPNQMYISSYRKFEWTRPREEIDSYMMKFHIRGVEVLRRRQKWNRPCNANWEDHDSYIRNNYLKTLGCRPSYIKSVEGVPICSTKVQMNERFYLRPDDYGVLPPCQEMKNIWAWYEESTIDLEKETWGRKGISWISIIFSEEDFKQISEIR